MGPTHLLAQAPATNFASSADNFMAEDPLRRIGARRISPQQFNVGGSRARISPSRRTIHVTPSEGGTFTANELGNIVPPFNARGFKVVRMVGGRYIRADNPSGLATEGPFSMSDWPSEEDDLSFAEEQQITKVIFDVSQ